MSVQGKPPLDSLIPTTVPKSSVSGAGPKTRPAPSRRRRLGLRLGGCGVLLLLLALVSPAERLRAPGSMNSGHEAVECEQCHRPAPGTLRQQLQANARHALGQRDEAVDFGYVAVGNADCLACHERPFDRHPVYRFNEPRFQQARQVLGPQTCTSCHAEHHGVRATVQSGFCSECHADLNVEDDPVDVPHVTLVAEKRWDTCLGCHDFHGNHQFTTPTKLEERISNGVLERYLLGGDNPYGGELLSPAKEKRDDVLD